MIVILLLAVALAALLQVIFGSLTLFGTMPQVGLLVVAWLSYRYGSMLALPLLIFAGFVLSFFVLSPSSVILAYMAGAIILSIGVYASDSEDSDMPVYKSVIAVASASILVTVISDISAFDALNLVQVLSLLLLTTLYTAVVWRLMLVVADPRR